MGNLSGIHILIGTIDTKIVLEELIVYREDDNIAYCYGAWKHMVLCRLGEGRLSHNKSQVSLLRVGDYL